MNRVPLALLALAAAVLACGRDATTAVGPGGRPSFVPFGPPVPPTTDRGPTGQGLFIPGWSEFRCLDAPAASKRDPDGDTMDNRCEDALAAAFAPGLRVAHDCNYDAAVGRQGGEYYYAVQPYENASSELVRIAYLPAYYWDCGATTDGPWPFPDVCPGCFGGGHDGDSEFFIVDVRFNDTTRHWITQQIFLSAHCGTVTGQYCMWYPDPTTTTPVAPVGTARPFSWVYGKVRGAPIIWVADGKHANYSSREDCDAGGVAGSETCDQNDRFYRFPVRFPQQNIWSRAVPHEPCVGASLWGSTRVAPGTTECFWPRRTFYGWQGRDLIGSTAYSDILAQYAGW